MILLVGYVLIVMGSAVVEAQVVDIPDPNLRAAIENTLSKTVGVPITADDMTTLTYLEARNANIGDLTGLEFAINLSKLDLGFNAISDLSPLAGLTKLINLNLERNSISDLSPLAGLTQLTVILDLVGNAISDLSPLAGLVNLTQLGLHGNSISDLSSLAGLTNLEKLWLGVNLISDISPLAGLTSLRGLWLSRNLLLDLSPLAGLVNLTQLGLHGNSISDLSSLAGLTNLEKLDLSSNLISDLSPLTELTSLTSLYLGDNSISDISPLVTNTGLGAGDEIDVRHNPLSDISINTDIPTLRSRGVTVHNTKLSIPAVKRTNVGDTFTLDLIVEDVFDLAGWQIDIAFNPQVLGAVSITEGDFLTKNGGNTFFLQGTIDNASGTITGVNQVFLGEGGVSGTGKLLSITLEAKATGQERLRLRNLALGSPNGDNILYALVANPIITVGASRDINGDGSVNISDLILVSQNLGSSNPQADINDDGKVNIFDLIAVAQYLGESTTGLAPGVLMQNLAEFNTTMIQKWIDMAYVVDDGSLMFQQGIANLKRLLNTIRPAETVLLTNYPNPFNPETWIPYHLAYDTDVTLTIYDIKGSVVRQFSLGYQQAGYYTDRIKAPYWDGRNSVGELVGSGVYFYQLKADHFSAMRKMVILK